ncbi:MAG: patatin-like phospholipase family protein [Cocleimonas sp.]
MININNTAFLRILNILTALICIFLVSSCSVILPEMNKARSSERTPKKVSHERSPELALFMTFSGGGTRSAALSYGVLKQLRDTTVIINHKKRRLLDEIDLISSVSGGSFTSAYFGLFGDQIFQDFETKFLKRQVQTELVRLSLLSPKAWIRLAPSLFERSDLAADYYSRHIFKKKRFSDLREDAPLIIINATDLSLGQGFAFTGFHFSWICSDLNSYPISRAVAASAAVPIVFSPITLRNHAENCQYSPIVWGVQNKQQQSKTNHKQKRYLDVLKVQTYRDNKQLKYLHLVDGGVADNLGIRSILDAITFHNDDMWSTMKTYGMKQTKKMVFMSVNAASFLNTNLAKKIRAPSTVDIIDTTTTIQSNKYNNETIDLLTSKFPLWKKQVKQGRCQEKPSHDCGDIEFELIEINLEDLSDSEIQDLGIVPTTLELPNKTVDQLISAGEKLTIRSKKFQNLLKDLK